jgi:hypothetical protein
MGAVAVTRTRRPTWLARMLAALGPGKWLYDRHETGSQPGRVLTEEDIAHYQRTVVALREMIRKMWEIDEVIEVHRGWLIE